MTKPKSILSLLPFLFLLFIGGSFLLSALTHYYPELLWFESFGQGAYWWAVLKTKAQIFGLFGIIAWSILKLNTMLAFRISKTYSDMDSRYSGNSSYKIFNHLFEQYQAFKAESPFTGLPKKAPGKIISSLLLLVALMMGSAAKAWWFDFNLWLNKVPFMIQDPIFGKDVSFYIFSLPLFQQVHAWFLFLLILTILAVIWVYFTQNILRVLFVRTPQIRIKAHLFILFGLLSILLAIGARFGMYRLLYSTQGTVYGAAYTDIHGQLVALKFLLIALCVQGLIFFVWSFRHGFKIPFYCLGSITVIWLFLGHIYPSFIQNYVVAPNEVEKETPYIKHNIKFTQMAYGLDRIEVKEYPIKDHALSNDTINQNRSTFGNLPLWNLEPLKATFKQLQEIRLYYNFSSIDVDRYLIDGQLQQVMLSPRELDVSQLSEKAQNWVNRHLIFTHGYGLCLSPISQFTQDGLPTFLIKDLPPVSQMTPVKRPEIYFGEKTDDYAVVNTKQLEFDYPKGDQNQMVHYQGQGGVALNSLFKRALFAWKFSDIKLLISHYIHSKSRLMFNRNIYQIGQTLLPFLSLDNDPYMVLSDDGRLLWVWDAYTSSQHFPYSEPFNANGINYMRNSAVLTIDAYSGQTNVYIKDKTDPIIQSISQAFPGLLKPLSKMPESIQAHLRYPKTLFSIQAYMYQTYHMTDPQSFFNREDQWDIPKERNANHTENNPRGQQLVKPYYIVFKLPGQSRESFVLMQTFTPRNKNNMVAWLSSNCDPDQYGRMTVYKLPKERTVFGPLQIESRIDQDPQISQSLTLWGQMGSKVIRGDLMVLPIENTIMYIEPIYLQATQSKLPELKRIILSHDNKLVMESSLEQALNKLLNINLLSDEINNKGAADLITQPLSSLDQLLKDLFDAHRSFKISLKSEKLSEFGQSLEKLDTVIKKLESTKPIKEKKP